MINKNLMKRILVVVVTILVLFTLQTTLLKMIPYVNISPNLMLVAVCSFGLLRGRSKGMWIGFSCGLLVDLFYGGEIIGLYALVYMYIGYLNGLLSEVLMKDTILVPMLFCFVSELLYHGYVYVFTYLLRRRLGIFDYIITIIGPEMVATMIFMVLIYGLLLLINRVLNDAERKGDTRIA